MKRLLLSLAMAAVAPTALLADSRYNVFKLSDDPHTIRTSEGHETLQAEYMVLEPSTRRVVAAVVTGGAVGERFVIVPLRAARFEGSREIVLTDVAKERLEDAPAIERGRLNGSGVLEAALIDNSYSHFGIERDGTTPITRRSDKDDSGGRSKSAARRGGSDEEPAGDDQSAHGRRTASAKKAGRSGD